ADVVEEGDAAEVLELRLREPELAAKDDSEEARVHRVVDEVVALGLRGGEPEEVGLLLVADVDQVLDDAAHGPRAHRLSVTERAQVFLDEEDGAGVDGERVLLAVDLLFDVVAGLFDLV